MINDEIGCIALHSVARASLDNSPRFCSNSSENE